MSFRCAFVTLSFFVSCVSLLGAQETRTWTDHSGNFTIEASFVAAKGDQVRIKNSDGKILTLSLDQLSREDRDYVESRTAANPFAAAEREADSGNPFAAAEQAGGTDGAAGSNRAKILKIDLNSVRDMGDYGDTQWSCEPDPTPIPKYPGRPRRLNFRLGNVPFGVHPEKTRFYFSPLDGKIAHTAVVLGSHHDKNWKNITRLFFGDVSTGKTHSIDHPAKLYPYGFAPDGKKLMFRQGTWEFGTSWGKLRKMYVVSYENGKITPLYAFEPFGQVPESDRGFNREKDIEWAAWVDDDHILVLSGNERLVLISLSRAEALWRITVSHSEKIALSPGGKYCIVPTSNQIHLLIETLTGETIGNLERSDRSFSSGRFAFSPDGKKIVSCDPDTVRIWEANTGKAYEPFFIRGASSSETVWVNNRAILSGNFLIDPVNKVPMWEYLQPGMSDVLSVGGCVWYTNSVHNEGYVLNGVVLPHPKVKLPDASVSDADVFILYPGMDVSLVLDNSISKDKDEIGKTVAGKLRENGLNIKDGAPMSVVLKQSREPEQKARYVLGNRFTPIFGRDSGGTEVSYRPEKYTIQIQLRGNTLWEETRITSPPDLQLQDVNENSLQAAVNKEMAKFSYMGWIKDVRIPEKINNPEKIGLSRLTEQGIADVERKELERFRSRGER